MELARQLIGAPRHLSQHPGGFVLTEERLDDLVPIEPAAIEDRQVIEWDKDDIDALKFMKVDVLALGMLSCMRKGLDLLREHKGIDLDLATIPSEDPRTYAMIRKADTAVIDKKEHGKRDTLAMPILYTARHAVELTLKFCARRLAAKAMQNASLQHSHNVSSLWQILRNADIGDREIAHHLAALKPYVDSLAAIDDDGQELRYHENIEADRSLSKYSLVSLEVVRDSLATLSEITQQLQYRTLDLLQEVHTGTHTSRCSRSDIFRIADMLPPIAQWKEPVFDEARQRVRDEYGISSNDFQRVIRVIKGNRELRARLGEETPLRYLRDEQIATALVEWRKWHPPEAKVSGFILKRARDIAIETIIERDKVGGQVIAAIQKLLTAEQLGELEALYYFGGSSSFFEDFDRATEEATAKYKDRDAVAQIVHLFSKGNLDRCLARALEPVGRLALARQIAAALED